MDMCRFLLFCLIIFSPLHAGADVLVGRDNLAAFYLAQVRARSTGEPIKIHFVGDSKVSGHGVPTEYRLDQLIGGATNGYPVEITFGADPGENSYAWAADRSADVVKNHSDVDLLIVDYGTNERYAGAKGGRQTTEDTKRNHSRAIAKLRSVMPFHQTSILLLGQTPANNWNPEYQQSMELVSEVNASLREVAAETDSAYFATEELFVRPHGEAGWMEQLPSPNFGGGNVHPGPAMNLVLVGELSQRLFPLPYKSLKAAATNP